MPPSRSRPKAAALLSNLQRAATSPWALRLAIGAGVLAALALAALLILFAALDRGSLDGAVMRFASDRLKRPVQFQSLKTDLLGAEPQFTIKGLRIGAPAWAQNAGPGGAPDLLRANHIHARFHWASLLRAEFAPSVLEIDGAEAHLLRLDRTHETWSAGEGGGRGGDPLARTTRLTVTNTRFVFDDRVEGMKLSGAVGHDIRRSAASPFTLTAAGTIRGGAVEIAAEGGPLNHRRRGAPYPMTARLVDGDAVFEASGTLEKPLSFKGFDLQVKGRGPNLVVLEYLLDLGTPNTTPFDIRGRVRREGEVTRATELSGTLGQSALKGQVISDGSGKRRLLTIDLAAETLHMRDLAAILADLPSHATARVTPGAPSKGDRLFSPEPLDLVRFNRKDWDLKITARRFVTGPIAPGALAVEGKLRNGVFQFDTFEIDFPSGRLDARYTLDVRQPDIRMALDARLRGAELSTLTPGLSSAIGGHGDVDLKIAGAGRSIRQIVTTADGQASVRLRDGQLRRAAAQVLSGSLVKGALTALVAKSSTTDLTCAHANFTIGKGLAATRDLILVSGAGQTVGEGAVDLRSETVDLRLYGAEDGVANTRKPVRVAGPLTKPDVDLRARLEPPAPGSIRASQCR